MVDEKLTFTNRLVWEMWGKESPFEGRVTYTKSLELGRRGWGIQGEDTPKSIVSTTQQDDNLCSIKMELIEPVKAVFLFSA